MDSKTPTLVISGWAQPAAALHYLTPLFAADGEVVELAGTSIVSQAFARDISPAEELQGIIQKFNSPVNLVGWSMGGMIAIETAARYPNSVHKMALLSTTPLFCARKDFPAGLSPALLEALRAGFKANPEKALLEFFVAVLSPRRVSTAELRIAVAEALKLGESELAVALQYLATTDLRTCCAKVKCPTLVLHGEADQIIPVACGAYLAATISHAEGKMVAGAGHDLALSLAQSEQEMLHQFFAK